MELVNVCVQITVGIFTFYDQVIQTKVWNLVG